MNRIKYSREQLLSLYREDYPLPEGMVRNQPTFVEKSLYPKILNHQTGQYHRNRQSKTSKRVETKIKKDIPQPSKSEEPVQKPIPAPMMKPVLTPLSWYYIDPSGKTQGPFASPQLHEWWAKKLFPADIKISNSNNRETFKEIKNYFPDLSKAFTYNPILFPFLGDQGYDESDPLHVIFKNFQSSILH